MAARRRQDQTGWTAISLQNFRRFEDTGVIRYAPVTLLFGKNSSGKTSILRGPLLLKQMLAVSARGEPSFSGAEADFGSFVETVFQGDTKRDITLAAEIISDDPADIFGERFNDALGPGLATLMKKMVVEVTLHWNQTHARTQYSSIRFRSSFDGDPVIEMTRTGLGKFNFAITGEPIRRIVTELNLQSLRQIALQSRHTGQGRLLDFDYFAFMLGNNLELAAAKLLHIGPLREQPNRAYQLDQIGIRAVGNTVDVLQSSRTAQKIIDKSLRDLGMASSATLAKLAPGFVAITLADAKTGRQDNLADVGFGVSQVLPILASLATVDEGSTILIEQPELHLHPDAQGKLADVLMAIGRERNLTLVIETHSEHILLRLQRRVAEGKIAKEDVATYFIDDGNVRAGPIDDFGALPDGAMPSGFFEEEWADLLKLTAAAAKRSK